LQRHTVQNGRVARAVAQDYRSNWGNEIQVVLGGMPFFSQKKLIISVSTQPLSIRQRRKSVSQQCLQFGNRARGTEVSAAKAARPGEKVQMRIDEPGENGAPATVKDLSAGRDKRAELVIRTDCENPPGRYCDRFGTWPGWVEGEDAPTIQQKVSDTGRWKGHKRG
jgi:hypothetical protein